MGVKNVYSPRQYGVKGRQSLAGCGAAPQRKSPHNGKHSTTENVTQRKAHYNIQADFLCSL